MPITTRNVPQKKPNGKHPPKKNLTTNARGKEAATGSRKRTTRDDEEGSEDDDDPDMSKLKKKRRRAETEIEVVDDEVPEKVVEDVDDIVGGEEPANEQDVSISYISWLSQTHHTLGRRSK
jgi:hypothetical protein